MIDQIRKVLEKEKGILLAYLYGSVAVGKEGPGSDIDVAILLKNTSILRDPYFESRLALKIEKALGTKKEVEIRILNGASLRFKNQVLKNGKLIYKKDGESAIKFETKTRDMYFDFKPFLAEYDKMREERLGITHSAGGR